MGFKTITIKEEVYDMIAAAKKKDESFSDLFERTYEKKFDIMKYAGAWKDMSEERYEEIKRDIKQMKKAAIRDEKERLKRLGLE